jgi:MFS family permease
MKKIVSTIDNVKIFYYFNFFSCFRPHWPIAIIYYQSITGSYALATAIFSVVFLSQALLELPTAFFSDTIGRKKTLILGAASASIGIFLYALGLNFWCLLGGAVFEGLAGSLFSGTKTSLLFESLKESKRSDDFDHVLGKTNSVYQIALSISAAIGGLFALKSLSLVFWIAVIPQILCFICAFFFVEPKQIERNEKKPLDLFQNAFKSIMANKKLRLISFSETLDFGFGEALFYFQGAFYKMLIPEWLIGFVRSLNHIFSALGFWFAGGIIKHFGYRNTLIGGNILTTALQSISVLIPTAFSPFIMTLVALFFGPSDTARSALMHQEFNDQQRATMESWVSLTSSLFFAIVSFMLGLIADFSSPIHAMLVGMSSNFVVLYVYFTLFGKKEPNSE